MPQLTTPPRLYRLLQSDPSVPANEIFRTFCNAPLKKEYKTAFFILQDPEKKRIYDLLSEPAVEHLTVEFVGSTVSTVGSTTALIFNGLVWLLITLLNVAFFIILPLKTDERVDNLSWGAVVTPLFILCFVLFLIVVSMIVNVGLQSDPEWACLSLKSAPILIYCLSGVLIGIWLTSPNIKRDWLVPPVLVFIADLINTLHWLWHKRPSAIKQLLESTKLDRTPDSEDRSLSWDDSLFIWMPVGLSALDILLSLIRNIILGLRISGRINISWYIVATFFSLSLYCFLFYRLYRNTMFHRLNSKSQCEVSSGFIGSFFLYTCITVSFFVVATRLEYEEIRLDFALIPIYFVLFYLCLASIFTVIYWPLGSEWMKDLEKDEQRHNLDTSL